MTIYDDHRVFVEAWSLYKQIDEIMRNNEPDEAWKEVIDRCSRFGRSFGHLAEKLAMAIADEQEERYAKRKNEPRSIQRTHR